KGGPEIPVHPDIEHLKRDVQRASRLLQSALLARLARVAWIDEYRHSRDGWRSLFEQLQPLRDDLRSELGYAGDVAAGPRQIGDQPHGQRVAHGDHDGPLHGGVHHEELATRIDVDPLPVPALEHERSVLAGEDPRQVAVALCIRGPCRPRSGRCRTRSRARCGAPRESGRWTGEGGRRSRALLAEAGRVGRSHAWRWADDHGFGKRWPRPAGFGEALQGLLPAPLVGDLERDPAVEIDPLKRNVPRAALRPPRISPVLL